jgi:hypothetical protein
LPPSVAVAEGNVGNALRAAVSASIMSFDC